MTFKEKRIGDRRRGERRSSDNSSRYKGSDRRKAANERRTTILNRLNVEVTDRRSIN